MAGGRRWGLTCLLVVSAVAALAPSVRPLPAQPRTGGTGGSAVATATASATASAQDSIDPLAKAFDAEDKNDLRRAADAYRLVIERALAMPIPDGDRLAIALLGLERSWAGTGARDSLLPLVQRVLVVRPTDPIARTLQLRTLLSVNQDDGARQAFLDWRRADRDQAAPYREYAKLLLDAGRARAADSLLAEAGRQLGTLNAVAGEAAQLHVAMARWNSAALAFRDALTQQPYLETSALYALARAPLAARDSIRTALQAPPVRLLPRRLLASLETFWGEPRRAWTLLSTIPVDDSTLASWQEFGERVEGSQSWQVARDVWGALLDRRPSLATQARAAQAALKAGDATSALAIVRRTLPGRDSTTATSKARLLLPIEVAALGELGRAAEAQQRIEANSTALDATARADLAPLIVNAWLRRGDLEQARRAVQASDLADDDETLGWLALYDGDLATARKRLVRAETRRPELVDALGLLARVRIDRSAGMGQAFLTLARRDTAAAAARFLALADSTGDAAPALLGMAARLVAPSATSRAATTTAGWQAAQAVWARILTSYPRSPDAPDALLASARAAAAAGDRTAAIALYERLLIDYPTSALLPQGRRELERLKGTIP